MAASLWLITSKYGQLDFFKCYLKLVMKDCETKWVIRYSIQLIHYNDIIMSAMASQITSHTIVYSAVYSGVDQRKHQSSASLSFVRGIHWSPVNSPHKRPVTQKMFPFDDVTMYCVMYNIQNKAFIWMLLTSLTSDLAGQLPIACFNINVLSCH